MAEFTKKEVCKCENCGNEAEMVVTCTLPDVADVDNEQQAAQAKQEKPQKIKGTATCSRCGNEADMWIDY